MEEEESSDRAEAAEQAAQEALEEDDEATEEAPADTAGAEESASEEEEESAFDESAGFPENFPRVSRLENAGVNSLAELRDVDDLTELDGIGASYAEDIEDGLKEFDEKGEVSG
jgi:small subunit ribosomal protein S1